MSKRLLEDIKHTVVFLGFLKSNKNEKGDTVVEVSLCGTGFLLQVDNVFFLATAKHVVAKIDDKGRILEELSGIHVFNNLKNKTVRFSSIDDIKKTYKTFYHPNEAIDLALIPFPLNEVDDDVKVFERSMFVNSSELVETYDTFFVSYQPGISDLAKDQKVLPVIRKGSIARINNDKSIYIDGSAFPGNSGSPVFVLPSPVRYSDDGINLGTDPIGGKFIGIISRYTPYSEVAISQQTGRPRVIFEENTGLSLLFPNHFILEIIDTEDCKSFIATHKSK